MATITRKIGLSLGADICWPHAYEDLIRELDLAIPDGPNTLRFAVERVTIEPFELGQPVAYDLVLDRLTHWYPTTREWIKKAIVMNGVYVWNNPWSVQANTKHTSYCAMQHLGLPIPRTVMIPPKTYDPLPDLQVTLQRYARLFDLAELGARVGYPVFLKPYDGGGWANVSKIESEAELHSAYDQSGKLLMHLQQGIMPFDDFVRCIGLGPQTRVVRYDPKQPLHGRYLPEVGFLADADRELLEDITLTINAFFGWDFNSCESLLKDGTWYPIDFANPCPDSQVTSLHCHWPWLVLAKIRWSLFIAATKRRMRVNLDWEPFYRLRERDLPYREKVREYAKVARDRLDAARFEDWCGKHLAHLDELALRYFGTERAKEGVRRKVEALYPAHEHDAFTERFWAGVQLWREREQQRSGSAARREPQAKPRAKR